MQISTTLKNNLYRNKREYIINFQKRRSLLALINSFLSLILAIYAIVSGIILYVKDGVAPIALFQYFTIDSSIIAAFGAAMIIPYAIDGYRKKRFYCPRWAMLLYYSGVTCTTLVMIFATLVISRVDIENAFFGYNLYLHIICPFLILVSFLLIESYYRFKLKDTLISMIPVFIYAFVYIYEVVIKGTKNGGWDDIYYFNTYVPACVSLIVMMIITFSVSLIIRTIYNKIALYRRKKLIDNLWDDSVSAVDIKIEFFGLGRYMGRKEYRTYATIPLDIIYIVAEKYHIKKEELANVFMKGMLDKIDEKYFK